MVPKMTHILNNCHLHQIASLTFVKKYTINRQIIAGWNWLLWYLIGEKKSGKIFVGEKFSQFWRISQFSPTNFSNSSLYPDQFLKLKGLSWMGLLFFQRKVVILVWDFSHWAWRSALLVSLIHGTGCCKYTLSWISKNKKFLYKLIFRDYKIFRRIPEEF